MNIGVSTETASAPACSARWISRMVPLAVSYTHLSIVRSIAQVHGGSVEAQSTLGEGSDFTVTLPLRREENPGVGEPD